MFGRILTYDCHAVCGGISSCITMAARSAACYARIINIRVMRFYGISADRPIGRCMAITASTVGCPMGGAGSLDQHPILGCTGMATGAGARNIGMGDLRGS